MKTKVGLSHEPKRKLPWLVYWFGELDSETGRQQKHSRSFKYNREAREFQAAKQAELDRGGPRDKPADVTLSRLLDEFDKARLAALSYASQDNYGNTIQQLRDYFGDTRQIRRVERRHAETFLSTRKRCNGRPAPLSSWSKARHLMHCRAIFGAAVEWGYISRNPFDVHGDRGASPLRIKPKARPWHHLTPDEFRSLLVVADNVRQRAAYWLMYGCGLRPGETYNLTIDRIDLKTRRVHIANRTATEDLPPFTVKADGQSSEGKERSVSIPEAAIPDLSKAVQQSFTSGRLVCLTAERYAVVRRNWRLCTDGQGWAGHEHRPWQNRDMVNNLRRDTKAYLRKAEVELSAPFTLTTFRKSFAQNHADAGTPPRTLAKLLGHTDTRVTMQFYNRVTDANERAAAEAMDRVFKRSRRAKGAS